jgi:hypothetical protein
MSQALVHFLTAFKFLHLADGKALLLAGSRDAVTPRRRTAAAVCRPKVGHSEFDCDTPLLIGTYLCKAACDNRGFLSARRLGDYTIGISKGASYEGICKPNLSGLIPENRFVAHPSVSAKLTERFRSLQQSAGHWQLCLNWMRSGIIVCSHAVACDDV